jgi:hypothetical protein
MRQENTTGGTYIERLKIQTVFIKFMSTEGRMWEERRFFRYRAMA